VPAAFGVKPGLVQVRAQKGEQRAVRPAEVAACPAEREQAQGPAGAGRAGPAGRVSISSCSTPIAAATMLAWDRHQVTVLEADGEGPPAAPAAAWEHWPRKGVAQFRQPHNVFPRFRQVCDEELPELPGRLAAAGCRQVDPLGSPADGGMLPPSLSDHEPRPGDEAFRYVTGRRPVVESVVAALAAEQPGLVIRRGERAAELIAGPSSIPGVPHVAGVRTSAGQQLRADLVVDAMGRRSRGAELLTKLGARPPHTEAETSGFAYYTRYFTGPSQPPMRGPVLMPLGTISLLTLYGDNDTWSVTIYTSSKDASAKACATPKLSAASSGRARCRRTGWTASRSPACSRWRASPTATTGSSSTAPRSRPDSPPSATPGPHPSPSASGRACRAGQGHPSGGALDGRLPRCLKAR